MIPPTAKSVLIIGGGPGGSYAAAALALEGFKVTLLESAVHPRYHIGESLLPSVRQFLRFVGAEELIKNHGFTPKPGAAVKLNQYLREGYTDFVALNPENASWNVVRSEFDELLLRHASACGANVQEGTRVTEILFSEEQDARRPVAVSWVKQSKGEIGQTSFDYLVDASGRAGIMSTRYLKNRKFNASLKNVACWGYWRGTRIYAPGTSRHNAPFFEALKDETGWVWYIPLHDGTVSIGIVMSEVSSKAKKSRLREKTSDSSDFLKAHYLEQLQLTPGVVHLIANGELSSEIKVAGDYSYSASQYAGAGYRLVGDAGAFIDPFFSSGVHLALTGGMAAAASIASSARGECTEAEAVIFYDAKVRTSYTRFLLVVLGVYKQIRAQTVPVWFDVNKRDFENAFKAIRPVIQGASDVGTLTDEDELQRTMDFCHHLFAPTTPEMHREVAARISPELTSVNGPVLTPDEVDKLVDVTDGDARHVLKEINARKPIHGMYDPDTHLTGEVLEGFTVRLERGNLGLARV